MLGSLIEMSLGKSRFMTWGEWGRNLKFSNFKYYIYNSYETSMWRQMKVGLKYRSEFKKKKNLLKMLTWQSSAHRQHVRKGSKYFLLSLHPF